MSRTVIGIPTRETEMVSIRWAMCFANLEMPANTLCPRIVNVGWEVGEARNSFAHDALTSFPDAEHIFFLDDDVLPHRDCLRQLLKAKKPIVSGVYFIKSPTGEAIIHGLPGTGALEYRPSSGLLGPPDVHGIPAGLLLVETAVLRDMRDRLDLGLDAHGHPQWFKTLGNEPGEPRMTEDIYFCRQAQAAGYDLWVDTDVYAFAWHYDAREHQGYPVEQWNQFIRGEKVTWKTAVRPEDEKRDGEGFPSQVILPASPTWRK